MYLKNYSIIHVISNVHIRILKSTSSMLKINKNYIYIYICVCVCGGGGGGVCGGVYIYIYKGKVCFTYFHDYWKTSSYFSEVRSKA